VAVKYRASNVDWFPDHRSASVTGNGGYPPFAPQGQTSLLTVCVTGGTQVAFSNIALVFGMPANGHFGAQAIKGTVRRKYRARYLNHSLSASADCGKLGHE
jgi:hypothetical protein